MTDDEIMALANEYADVTFDKNGQKEYEFDNIGVVEFARAIEARTLTNQKARWYQVGVEAEREACAKICDEITGEKGRQYILASYIAQEIRTRGE